MPARNLTAEPSLLSEFPKLFFCEDDGLNEFRDDLVFLDALGLKELDAFVARGGGDFMTALAGSLPVEIAVALLGFPARDAPHVKRMSDNSVALLSGILPPRDRVKLIGSGLSLYAYSLVRFYTSLRRGSTGTQPHCCQRYHASRVQHSLITRI